jgi:hypothetical protein
MTNSQILCMVTKAQLDESKAFFFFFFQIASLIWISFEKRVNLFQIQKR